MNDPFTQAYDALWAALEASPEFVGAVKPGNRIKVCGPSQDPAKGNVQHGDLPEVALGLGPFEVEQTATSDALFFSQQYQLVATTGSMVAASNASGADKGVNQLLWIVLKALLAGYPNFGKPGLIARVRITGGTLGFQDTEANRGTKGWSFALTITLTLRCNRRGSIINAAGE